MESFFLICKKCADLDNSPPLDVSKDTIEDLSKSNEEFSSTDDDSFSLENIDYVEASPPDSELVSSECSHMEEIDLSLNPVEPNSRDFTKDVVEDISLTKEPQVLNTLPIHPTLQLSMKFQPSSEYLLAYVVWIFLLFLVYSVVPCYLLSLQNEDIIFDPGICKSTFSKPDISHRCGNVKTFNTHRSHLNTFPMMIHGQNNPPLDVLLIPGFMKILANGFHYLKSSYSPLFNLRITGVFDLIGPTSVVIM
nr:hypothetical protein [Tanacetum cinerariifolium]